VDDAGRPTEASTVSTDSVEILAEPSDRASRLLGAINGAKTSIHVTMYLLGDKRFIDALVAQTRAGLDVKVVLNKSFPPGGGTGNQPAFDTLTAAGVSVKWAPVGFTLTHEKCVLVDRKQAWIMTMNLESSSSQNREFLAIDTHPADVDEAEAVFAGDYANMPVVPTGALLVAPVNARDRLVALIQSAKTSVDVEGEEMSDTKIVGALVAAKKAGFAVRVVLPKPTRPASSAQGAAVRDLTAAGVVVVSVATPYIHAKAIVVDGARAYVGSENYTTGSLQYNRELGLITDNAAAVAVVASTITKDAASGVPY